MSDLQQSLINWVSFIQINTNDISKKVETFLELSDGVVLYEVMSQLSPSIFNKDYLTYEAFDNWALCLANLRRLHRGVKVYIEQNLQENSDQDYFDIDLVAISHKGNGDGVQRLVSIVLYIAVNCEQKQCYIEKIMSLSEEDQAQLMYLIESIINTLHNQQEKSGGQNSESMQSLRREQSRLLQELSEVQGQLEEVERQKTMFKKERDQLLTVNTDLQTELIRMQPPTPTTPGTRALSIELEQIVLAKENFIQHLQQEVQVNKDYYENQIHKLKDELDVQHQQLVNFKNSQQEAKRYREKLGKMLKYKAKHNDLMRQYELMQAENQRLGKRLTDANKYKAMVQTLKGQVKNLEERENGLSFTLETREAQIKEQTKLMKQLQEKFDFATQKIRELEFERRQHEHSPLTSNNDSFYSTFKDYEEMMRQEGAISRQRSGLPYWEPEDVYKARLMQEEAIIQYEQILEAKKFQIQMIKEDWASDSVRLREQLEAANEQVDILSAQLELLGEQLEMNESEKNKYTNLLYELQDIKKEKDNIFQELKKVYSEKDEMTNKYIQTQKELIQVSSRTTKHDMQIREKDQQIQMLQKELNQMKKYQEVSEEQLRETMIKMDVNDAVKKVVELERLNINLQQQIDFSKIQQQQVQKQLQSVIQEKNNRIKQEKEQNSINVQKLKQDQDQALRTMELQTQEAINRLQSEKDSLVQRLQFKKQNTLLDFKRAVSIVGEGSDKKKLRQQISAKNKKIQRLKQYNLELSRINEENRALIMLAARELEHKTLEFKKALKKENSVA